MCWVARRLYGDSCGWVSEHPLHDAALGEGVDAEMAEHVDHLSAVVHAVCGDMGEDAATGEVILLAVTRTGEDVVVRAFFSAASELSGRFGMECAEVGNRVSGVVLETGAGRVCSGEDIGPAARGTDDVGEGFTNGA